MRLLYKLSFTKIKKNIGRFLSVLFIVALGVGFFAGLRETTPDIKTTLDNYYDENNLMDFKITSTLGLTNDDITSLKSLTNVDKVIPTYSVDALINGEEVRIHAIEEEINNVILIAGDMPKKADECIADATNYQIGDILTITKMTNEGMLKNDTYKVVGLINSPMYISRQYGIASIGSGELSSFIYIEKENFISEVYTEVYITAQNSLEKTSYEDEYNDITNSLLKQLEELKPIRETKRYEEILEAATIEISKIESEATKEITTYEQELNNALTEINNGKKTLNEAKNKISVEENKISLEEQNYLAKINDELNSWQNNYQIFINNVTQIGLTVETLEEKLNNLEKQIDELNNIIANTNKEDSNYIIYEESLTNLNAEKANIEKLINTKITLDNSKIEIEKNQKNFETEIANAKSKINSAKEELNKQENEINNAYTSYLNNLETLNMKKQELTEKITLAKASLNEIEKPIWYLLDRSDNNGYASIWDDAIKVDAISKIFPIFFIAVVALMCFNTMNRMIEEERSEIGVLSSLGYSNFKIINGYLFYIFLATIIGVTIGLLLGYTIIPQVIYSIYNANYILPKLIITIKIWPFIIIILITIFLMSLIAILSCLKELKNVPAIILRPKAPKAGKKVLLEHIKIIWKRLSFTSKVTTRNMFRYKKRIIMTVLGVVGSTALLLTGFGLRDSVNGIVDLQYGQINHYDALFVFNNSYSTITDEITNKLAEDNIKYLPIYQESFTFEANNINHDVYLIATSKEEELTNYITFNSKVNEEFIFPKDGVVISEKMASLLNVNIGDLIKIRNSNNELIVLPVSEIIENYTLHYIYMNESAYELYFEKDIKYNMLMATLNDDINHEELANKWLSTNLVSTINFTEDNILVFDNMIKGLNKVVFLIISASSMLALIVLYNLTTINIAERIREISTLKVLGFYDKEVSSYVYRETLFLTILGIIIGFGSGVLLHMYVIKVAETDNIVFLHRILWPSYIYTFIIVIFFTIIVKLITDKKLKKINMIESLKSVE